MITQGNEAVCPGCGNRPYRSQPSPLNDDMAMRDMVEPGVGDMGGNPLQEGILADGGWKNRQKRDESFASVKEADRADYTDKYQQGDFQKAPMDLSDALAAYEQGLISWEDYLAKSDEYNSWRDLNSPPPEGENPEMQVRQGVPEEHILNWHPGTEGRGIFLKDKLHTWPVNRTPEEPFGGLMHGEYTNQFDVHPNDVSRGFEISPEGKIIGAYDPSLTDQIGSVDPRIQPEEDGWGFASSIDPKRKSIDMSEFDDFVSKWNPSERTLDQNPYPHLWDARVLRLADAMEQPEEEPDFELESVTPPGDPTIEATPHPQVGIHNGADNFLAMIPGLRVNGKKHGPGELVREFSPVNPNFTPGTPVTVSHKNATVLDMAKDIIETAQEREAAKRYHAKAFGAIPGQISPISGTIDPNLHTSLGLLHAYVEDPLAQQLVPYGGPGPSSVVNGQHEKIRSSYQGGPLRIAGMTPEAVRAIEQVAATGDPTPVKEYLRTAAFKEADLLDTITSPIGDVAKGIGHGVSDAWNWANKPSILGMSPLAVGGLAGLGLATGGFGLLPEAGAAGAVADAAEGGSLLGRGAGMVRGMPGALKGALNKVPGINIGGETGGLATEPNVDAYGDYMGRGTDAVAKSGLGSKAKSLGSRYLQYQGINSVLNQQGGGGGGGYAPSYMSPPESLQQLQSRVHQSDMNDWHPSSDEVMHPDAHEINDGDNQNWGYGLGVNGIGGADQGQDGLFGDPEVQGKIEQHMPKIVEYFFSDKSGLEDPDLKQLHDELSSKDPEYLNKITPEHEHDFMQLLNHGLDLAHKHLDTSGKQSAVPGMPPATPQVPGADTLGPGAQRMCPKCGHTIPAGTATCPYCQDGGAGMTQPHVPSPPQAAQPLAKTAYEWGVQQPAQMAPAPPPPNDTQQTPGSNAPAPTCPHCGKPITPGTFVCPNCNQSVMGSPSPMQPQAHQAGSTQGPQNREQFAAVAELLQEEGRPNEVIDMLQNPWNYAEELARIQNRIKPTPDDDSIGGPPEPAVEEAPPGATMPVPGMDVGQQMQSAVEKYATPNAFTKRCPRCNSGSTGLEGEKGTCICHSCGHHYKQDVEKDMFLTSAEHDHHEHGGDEFPNTNALPAADQIGQRDISKEEDSSLSWQDVNSEPLHVGQEYEMHSANYSIPDIIRIEAVKPNSIEYALTGEYGLEHRTEVTREEAELEGLTFQPANEFNDAEPSPEQPSGDDHERLDPGQQGDLSTPHQLMTHVLQKEALTAKDFRMIAEAIRTAPGDPQAMAEHFASFLQHTNPNFDVDRFIAAATGQPSTQRDVFQPQPDPNIQPPDISGGFEENDPNQGYQSSTKTADDFEDYVEEVEKETDKKLKEDEEAKAKRHKRGGEEEIKPHLAYLLEDTPDTVPVEWSSKEAGAKYTPMEQREFIEERGVARNLSDLDLSGTHFEFDDDDDESLFL